MDMNTPSSHCERGRYQRPKVTLSGFTLTELLMVIAIIGILAAIIFASIGAARRASHKARSISNIRQIQQGLVLYNQDHRRLPQLAANSSFTEPFWNHSILPYVGVESTPEDPTDPWRSERKMPDFFYDPAAETSNVRRGDYGVVYSNTEGPVKLSQPSLSLLALVNPSKTPLVVTAQQFTNGEPVGSWYALNAAAPFGTGSEVSDRHGGNSIIGFADGHVRVIPRAKFYEEYMPFINE